MKKTLLVTLTLLLFFSLPLHTLEAKTKKAKRIQKTKIINCSMSKTSASKIFIGSGNCYAA